jgi:hypothetical protein
MIPFKWICGIAAIILFMLATLAAGGVITGNLAWALPGGLVALTLAILV